MKRREALEKTTWILKSTLFAPSVVGFIQSCSEKEVNAGKTLVLSEYEYRLLSAMADIIIPKTESPAASEVKVVEFMDLLLNDVFDEETKDQFIAGIKRLDEDCLAQAGSRFTKLDEAARVNYLTELDQEVMSSSFEDQVPFYYSFKQLCVNIYFSTEQGIKQNLDYQPIPGSFQGDLEMDENSVITVGNHM
jgi:hypothetical protein